MPEAGIYTLTKVLLGGVSALMTGPLGTMDLPEGSIEGALTSSGPGTMIELVTESGESLGVLDNSSGGSPGEGLLHPAFVPGLIATEDSRFFEHPGVDPFGVLSALADIGRGQIRGASSLTQQSIKNEILGNDRTIERKTLEAIIALRAVHAIGRERILDGYLSRSWFGKGVIGTIGAPGAWFGKTWDEVSLSETAFLIGLLKGPARYDPQKDPERARVRRDEVLSRMRSEGVISGDEEQNARSEPLVTRDRFAIPPLDTWVRSIVLREIEAQPLPASDKARATITIHPEWQALTQEAVRWGAERVDGSGPAGRIAPDILESGDHTRIRGAMAAMVDASPAVGRALVTGTNPLQVLLDRGFGPLEPGTPAAGPGTARIGDVFAYSRIEGRVELVSSPRVNAAAVVMEAGTGAILAVVGGANPETSRFDRSAARRQVGSAIKPFLWARALEEGYLFDDFFPDVQATYRLPNNEIWSPQNYDRQQSGLIPLFVALEESSNNVAARLIDQLGAEKLAEITEAAGVYGPGEMRRHPSSALGTSESSVLEMAAGYASIANGGRRVTPHVNVLVESGTSLVVPDTSSGMAVMTGETASLVRSMLYGVTIRGTAAQVFGARPPIAGKTGTTQSHKDAWFIGFNNDLVIAVWVGRDDNTPLPAGSTGARVAAPIAARMIEAAGSLGLMRGHGEMGGQAWPPALLSVGQPPPQIETSRALVFEPDPEARRRAMQHGADPFKNPQDLFNAIRNHPEGEGGGAGHDANAWDSPTGLDPWGRNDEEGVRSPFSPD